LVLSLFLDPGFVADDEASAVEELIVCQRQRYWEGDKIDYRVCTIPKGRKSSVAEKMER
jgi:hypothetical protein